MNILLYVNSFLPAIGGKEIVVHYLAKELQGLGHKVRIVGPSGWIKNRHIQSGYPVHRWPTLRGFYKESVGYQTLRLDIACWGCDVIHAHTTYPNGYLASKMKQSPRIPLVITPHGHDIHVIPEMNFGHRLDPIKARKIEHALTRAELVTAISDSVRASIIDAGCDTDKIRSIPNGIDVNRFKQDHEQDIRSWLGLEPDTRLILSVGNYHPRKGHNVIIEAMPELISRIPKARLVLVGANQEPLSKLIDDLNLTNYVRLTGAIPFPFQSDQRRPANKAHGLEDRLAGLYLQSDVYVSASINKEAEGLSLAMLDAMAAGLPVVATEISGSSDVLLDGKTGYLVPPGQHRQLSLALFNILGNEEDRAKMGCRGRQIAKRYHWREIAKQYLSVYTEAIESAGRSK